MELETSHSEIEILLGLEGRDLVEGIKPIKDSMYLLGEKIRLDIKPTGGGARTSILESDRDPSPLTP